jgi:hypothetical protein
MSRFFPACRICRSGQGGIDQTAGRHDGQNIHFHPTSHIPTDRASTHPLHAHLTSALCLSPSVTSRPWPDQTRPDPPTHHHHITRRPASQPARRLFQSATHAVQAPCPRPVLPDRPLQRTWTDGRAGTHGSIPSIIEPSRGLSASCAALPLRCTPPVHTRHASLTLLHRPPLLRRGHVRRPKGFFFFYFYFFPLFLFPLQTRA